MGSYLGISQVSSKTRSIVIHQSGTLGRDLDITVDIVPWLYFTQDGGSKHLNQILIISTIKSPKPEVSMGSNRRGLST